MPESGAAVSIEAGASEGMTTVPSITTSTGVVNALTTRRLCSGAAQQAVLESLPHAAATDSNRNDAMLAGKRMTTPDPGFDVVLLRNIGVGIRPMKPQPSRSVAIPGNGEYQGSILDLLLLNIVVSSPLQ